MLSNRFSIVFLLALSLSLPAEAEPAKGDTRLVLEALKTIVIDPGHGGENEGCIGPANVREKVVTLEVALEIERQLRARTRSEVILTRRTDRFIGLRERTRLANEKNGDVFISVHMNASPTGSGVGIETFLLSATASDEETRRLVEREEGEIPIHAEVETVRKGELDSVLLDMQLRAAHTLSERFASRIQEAMIRTTKATSRGVKQAPFAVLKEAKMPAIVLECGFLTHPKEGFLLLNADYQKVIAKGVVDGLIRFDQSLRSDP